MAAKGKNREGYPDPTASEAIGKVANYERRIKGRQSRIAGEHFESMLQASLDFYRDLNLAYIEKTPEPMKPIRPIGAGRFEACYTKSGQPDFKGTLTGGRSIVFEAKHTDGDRIEASRLTEEQIKALETHYQLGAAAFVVVSIGLQDFYRIPWEVWRDMEKIYGHKHIKQTELEPFRVAYMAGVIKVLDGVELEYGEEGETDGNQ
ncbi:recombinase [Eisenbergiella tayi]|uniref:Holliday junction resolvase RecU n=1 Tax=Eisenbergiella porci TaxID=2652274 RepID=A0A6N7WL43_9FIRM|nr:Holliday junction resolvase RecU [Eisenbergiella porci]MSS90444.1 recombinase [Eisenbergiella porci]